MDNNLTNKSKTLEEMLIEDWKKQGYSDEQIKEFLQEI